MQKFVTLVLGMALVAMAVPTAAAEDSVREQNREYLLDLNPNFMPTEMVEVHTANGVITMSAADALDTALDRAGDTSLAQIAEGASHGTTDLVGDIWLIGSGNVDCGTTTSETVGAGIIAVDTQLWIYAYEAGYNTGSSADFWSATSWTMKEGAVGSGTVNYGGASDFFCIEGGFFGLLFPFITGYSTAQAVPPA